MINRFRYRPRSLFGKLILSHFVIVFLTLLIMGFLLTHFIENYFYGTNEVEIREQAMDVADKLEEELKQGDRDEVKSTARELSEWLEVKIRVLDHDGDAVIVVSPEEEKHENPQMQRTAGGVGLEESEINDVLQGNQLTKKIYGPYRQRLLVAIPILDDEESAHPTPHGMVTLSAPLGEIEATLNYISRLIFYSGLIGATAAGLTAFTLSKKITRPLQVIRNAALNLASGDYQKKIDLNSGDEIEDLAHTFNYSAQQVEITIEEQKKLEELRRNLVANVSHELRAPLSSMQGYTEIMLDGLIEEKEKEKYLRIILENSEHLSRLVDDLMDLSKLESGEMSLHYETISPETVAMLSLESIRPLCSEKDIELQSNIENNPPLINADQNRLHQIITNLLENAVEHSRAGGEIIINLYHNHEHVIIEVIDNGPGIPEKDLPYIWDRFHKVDKSRRRTQKGTGLGLAITKQLVELHHGEIEVESWEEKGSIFRIYLPFNKQDTK